MPREARNQARVDIIHVTLYVIYFHRSQYHIRLERSKDANDYLDYNQ